MIDECETFSIVIFRTPRQTVTARPAGTWYRVRFFGDRCDVRAAAGPPDKSRILYRVLSNRPVRRLQRCAPPGAQLGCRNRRLGHDDAGCGEPRACGSGFFAATTQPTVAARAMVGMPFAAGLETRAAARAPLAAGRLATHIKPARGPGMPNNYTAADKPSTGSRARATQGAEW